MIASYILRVTKERPDVVKKFFTEHLGKRGEEGFMTGARQPTEQVRKQSEAKGKAEGILRVLARRRIAVAAEQRATVRTTTDVRWLDVAVVCASAEEVFGGAAARRRKRAR